MNDSSKLRSAIVRAANGAMVCGDEPDYNKISRTVGCTVAEMRAIFPKIDDLIAATGRVEQTTYPFKY